MGPRAGAAGGAQEHDYKFAWWVIFATVPIVVAGLLFQPLIKGPLASLWVVAGVADRRQCRHMGRRPVRHRNAQRGRDHAAGRDAGRFLADPGSPVPGFLPVRCHYFDRALRGLDRVAATRLSFFLSIPALTGAGVYELKDAVGGGVDVLPLLVGTVVSFVVAYASIAWLLKFVAGHTFTAFVVYRVVVGVALLGVLVTGVLNP